MTMQTNVVHVCVPYLKSESYVTGLFRLDLKVLLTGYHLETLEQTHQIIFSLIISQL